MPQFVVVSANTLAELETRVNNHIERFKFEPVGGVCYSNHAACYVQGGLVPDAVATVDVSVHGSAQPVSMRVREKGGKK